MDNLVTINKLKKLSFYLFIVPVIGIVGSLIFQNIITSTKFFSDKVILNDINPTYQEECNELNDYCIENNKQQPFKLSECNTFYIEEIIRGELNESIKKKKREKKINKENFVIDYSRTNFMNKFCIKNSSIYKYHKIFPLIINSLSAFKVSPNYRPGVNGVINPFIYGETSISNIVKRFPINYFFKPVMMIVLLSCYFNLFECNKILNILSSSNNNYWFMYFGIASSFSLFFHVFFLGTDITNETFSIIRKIILLLFIIFELFAQVFLTRKFYLMQNNLNNFISKLINDGFIRQLLICFLEFLEDTLLVFMEGFLLALTLYLSGIILYFYYYFIYFLFLCGKKIINFLSNLHQGLYSQGHL